MRKMRVVLSIVLILAVVFSTTALATVGRKTAELAYNNIKIMLNDKEIVPTDVNGNAIEPFIIDGTTYLPVRGIASALGLNVSWDAATYSVILDNPGVFTGGVQVYDDEYVTIEFAGCRAPEKGALLNYYYADFNIKNKTDYTLTFQPGALSFDGISYQFLGSEEVAPKSTGKVSFYSNDILPVNGVSNTSGTVSVIDFEYELFESSYDAKWVEIAQK